MPRKASGTAKYIRHLRKAIQILALLFFLYLFVFATYMDPVPGLAEIFYRFDPLVALTAMLAGRVLLAGFSLAGITVFVTLLFGRVWCGWLCPMGTTLDIFRPGRKSHKDLPKPPSEKWRKIKYILLALIVTATVFGNQSLLFLDPITIMTRTLSNSIWPAIGHALNAAESLLYKFDLLWGPLDAVHRTVIYPVFRDLKSVYPLAVPLFLVFAGIVALNWWVERFWCRYLCPLGGLLGLLSRFSLFRRVVKEDCTSCAVCSHRCPTGTIDPARNYASDPAECTVCYNCIDSCPQDSAAFQWQLPHWKPAERQSYDPSRREVLKAIGLSAAWVALSQVEPIVKRPAADLIRPPGANLVDFEELCIRCNECVRVCPTQGLQASFLEGGWQNMLTPRLDPRIGPCLYTCNACSQACPTGAIPHLSLEDKRHSPIGLARIDRNRCLPWAYNIECIVCEEMCPIPNKAIKVEEVEVLNGQGEVVTIQRPHVVKELCIGCGVCEFQCPMGGDAAIRVFTYTQAGGYLGNDPSFGANED